MARRGMETMATCTFCGMEEETTYHAMLRCPPAKALWEAMCEEWRMPPEELLFPQNPDWFLHMIRRADIDQRVACLMTFWRTWHVHNEITHQKKPPPVESSKRFLTSYIQSLMLIQQNPVVDTDKGKQVVEHTTGFKKSKREGAVKRHEKHTWKPPDAGMMKLNVDGGFSEDGRAVAGMILRNSSGTVIFAACRKLDSCADALDAELAAMEEGLALALAWEPGDFVLETDCADAIKLVAEGNPNLSRYAMRVRLIRERVRERGIGIVKVCREANGASHGFTALGRVHDRTGMWRHDYPPEIAEAITADRTPTV